MTIDRSQGRHLRGTQSAEKLSNSTITGNRALQIEEPLIFEQGAPGRTGVDLPVPDESLDRLGGCDQSQIGEIVAVRIKST